MLDLEPRVHLEKVEVARGVHEELQRPRVDVPDRSRPRDRGARETVFDRRRQIRRGGLLDELLMAALDRALALVKVDGRQLAVAEHLDLDVARAIEVALDVDVAPAERGLGTPGRRRERRRQVLGLVHPRHADAATAGHCLEDHGIPDLASDALGLTGVRHRLVAARHHHDAGGGHEPPRLGLVTHLADGVWRRADEDQARAAARLGKAPVLGEKAVAGMNGIGTARARGLEDPVDVLVALARWWRPNRHGVIGLPDVGRIAIRLGKSGDSLKAQLPAGAEYAPRDLPSVGDQDGADQRRGRAGWGASIRATSSMATRQPSGPGAHRLRTVTDASGPSSLHFTRRWWPSRAKATRRRLVSVAAPSARGGSGKTPGASQRASASRSRASRESPKAPRAARSSSGIGQLAVGVSRRMNSRASSLVSTGTSFLSGRAGGRPSPVTPPAAVRSPSSLRCQAPARSVSAGVTHRWPRIVSPAAMCRRSSSIQPTRIRRVGGS